jgi:hypothetical protein
MLIGFKLNLIGERSSDAAEDLVQCLWRLITLHKDAELLMAKLPVTICTAESGYSIGSVHVPPKTCLRSYRGGGTPPVIGLDKLNILSIICKPSQHVIIDRPCEKSGRLPFCLI